MLVDWQSAIFCHNRRFSSKRDDAARVFDSERAARAGFHFALCPKAYLNVKLKVSSIYNQFRRRPWIPFPHFHFPYCLLPLRPRRHRRCCPAGMSFSSSLTEIASSPPYRLSFQKLNAAASLGANSTCCPAPLHCCCCSSTRRFFYAPRIVCHGTTFCCIVPHHHRTATAPVLRLSSPSRSATRCSEATRFCCALAGRRRGRSGRTTRSSAWAPVL